MPNPPQPVPARRRLRACFSCAVPFHGRSFSLNTGCIRTRNKQVIRHEQTRCVMRLNSFLITELAVSAPIPFAQKVNPGGELLSALQRGWKTTQSLGEIAAISTSGCCPDATAHSRIHAALESRYFLHVVDSSAGQGPVPRGPR